ncbi:MAG: acyl-ACP--UDP-N-acetylglucosamine O-acyltransferase [Burkholderiaceae bacterium]|nr:acyl-ACP--UDP-N-acetylglucosamine O-acyltransferase [Burkholderiaceae bacterium]
MTSALIHPTAIVDPGAEIDRSVTVGPYAVIGAEVSIGARTQVGAHCVIDGRTTIGVENVFHPFSRIGGAPQDKKYAGEATSLRIGDRNMFREYVTLNRGTVQDRSETTIGSDNWIMAYVHVAHDCVLGDGIIVANNTSLAGHVHLGDFVVLGGFTGIHQFCKVGPHAMTGVGSVVLHDVPPFVMVSGNTASAHGINAEGLRRRGFSRDRVNEIRRAYRLLYKSGLTLEQARVQLRERVSATQASDSEADLRELADFLDQVTRGIVR